MPNRKLNTRFPPARIKKIMRTDKEVGKVAAPVPVVISRSLELFAEALLQQAGRVTQARGSRTLSPAHLKQCILSVRRFDFLRELVADIPDTVSEEAADPDDGEASDRRTQNGAGSGVSSQRLPAAGVSEHLDGDARVDPDDSSGSTLSAAAPTPTPPQQCMSSMADASAILSMHQQLQLQQQQLAASTAAAAASHGGLLWHMYQPVPTAPDAGSTMLAVQYGAVLPEHQQQCSSPPPSSHHHQPQY